jgi:tetratricopeptide (TPR) repeat protein
LLRARLLFDGGYFQRAYDLLKNAASVYASNPKMNLEYNYRMGRIAHRLGKAQEAKNFYGQTIQAGEKSPWYFACNAALQLGALHEEKKDWKNARTAYQKCLDIKPEEFSASLHARAKAGLNRLKNK